MTAPRPEPQTEARLTLPPDLVRRFDVLLDAAGRRGGIHMTSADLREFVDGILTAVAERLAEERLAIEAEARAPLAARMREAVESARDAFRVYLATEADRAYLFPAYPFPTALREFRQGRRQGLLDAITGLQTLPLAAAPDAAPDAAPRPDYERRVQAMADALHEDCRLEWQAIGAVGREATVTQHGADAHYGQAHDLVRRLWPELDAANE